MGDLDVRSIPDLKIAHMPPLQVTEASGIEPLRIGQIAPAAVHIKELNHVDPISVESLRIDQLRNVEPVRIERFDVTHLPTVNLSLGRLPNVDLNVRRVPPIAVGVHQDFDVPSEYTVHARLLGVEVLRLNIHGRTVVMPRDRAHREQARSHERSFPDVAAVGNPAIPARAIETHAEAVPLSAGCPRFNYSLANPRGGHASGSMRPGGRR
jgi:hypothetical protein